MTENNIDESFFSRLLCWEGWESVHECVSLEGVRVSVCVSMCALVGTHLCRDLSVPVCRGWRSTLGVNSQEPLSLFFKYRLYACHKRLTGWVLHSPHKNSCSSHTSVIPALLQRWETEAGDSTGTPGRPVHITELELSTADAMMRASFGPFLLIV